MGKSFDQHIISFTILRIDSCLQQGSEMLMSCCQPHLFSVKLLLCLMLLSQELIYGRSLIHQSLEFQGITFCPQQLIERALQRYLIVTTVAFQDGVVTNEDRNHLFCRMKKSRCLLAILQLCFCTFSGSTQGLPVSENLRVLVRLCLWPSEVLDRIKEANFCDVAASRTASFSSLAKSATQLASKADEDMSSC